MTEQDPNYSVIEYVSGHEGYRCGYCKSSDTNFSHGMWAHRLTVSDYQDLIDRGWRRSGQYCYKPTMDKTCCPQYTIRCDALNYKLSKSQKKVIKRMNAFLRTGKRTDYKQNDKEENVEPSNTDERIFSELRKPDRQGLDIDTGNVTAELKENPPKITGQSAQTCSTVTASKGVSDNVKINKKDVNCEVKSNVKHKTKPGLGADPSKPARKKAKLLRQEKRAKKISTVEGSLSVGGDVLPSQKGTQSEGGRQPHSKKRSNEPKSLEDLLNDPLGDSPAHRLEFRLVPAGSQNSKFRASFDASFDLFRRYQMTIHQEAPSDCEKSSFVNFLVEGPLSSWKPSGLGRDHPGYGAFHEQYWLDGSLIAVAVLDVLPRCVSSVYLFYHPDYSFLSLGTYSSVREIALTRKLSKLSPELKWYYMGFYIHSCPKMRYKGNYYPSFLLCPETYRWVPIERCTPKLDTVRYAKLSDDSKDEVEEDCNKILCLYKRQPILYGSIRALSGHRDVDKLKEYLSLVGPKLANSLLYYYDDS